MNDTLKKLFSYNVTYLYKLSNVEIKLVENSSKECFKKELGN